jgi:BarA-like signal transduction histidine kinase
MESFSVCTAENGKEGLKLIENRDKQALLAQTPVAVVWEAADMSDVQQQYGCSLLKQPVSVDRFLALAHAHYDDC